MSEKHNHLQEQPGLEVVTTDQTYPETAFIENHQSPPPQPQFSPEQQFSLHHHHDPAAYRSSYMPGTATTPSNPLLHAHTTFAGGMKPSNTFLDSSPNTAAYLASPLTYQEYEANITSAGGAATEATTGQSAGEKNEKSLWQRRKYWIMGIGGFAALILIIGAVLGGTLGSQPD